MDYGLWACSLDLRRSAKSDPFWLSANRIPSRIAPVAHSALPHPKHIEQKRVLERHLTQEVVTARGSSVSRPHVGP
jgi:hypothetical protein